MVDYGYTLEEVMKVFQKKANETVVPQNIGHYSPHNLQLEHLSIGDLALNLRELISEIKCKDFENALFF